VRLLVDFVFLLLRYCYSNPIVYHRPPSVLDFSVCAQGKTKEISTIVLLDYFSLLFINGRRRGINSSFIFRFVSFAYISNKFQATDASVHQNQDK
jgi:hypothetical protein